jgi:XRE family aerobic/anaerobic benzoate catabolism transcriptional regulator
VADPEDNHEGDDEVVRAIGARVRQLREAADLTQEELGARSNLTPKFISKVENGHANPSIGVVARLCVGLNLPLSVFFAEDAQTDIGRDLATVALLLSGETPEVRAQAIRILRALLGR